MPKTASYGQVVSEAIRVPDLEEEEEEKGEGDPSVFRIDGTVVPDSPINDMPWTLARYLKSLHKTAGQLRLGVGYYYRVSLTIVLHNLHNRIMVQ